MTARTVVLIDDKDRRIGRATVPETTHLIRHGDDLYVRTPQGIRLPGGGRSARTAAEAGTR